MPDSKRNVMTVKELKKLFKEKLTRMEDILYKDGDPAQDLKRTVFLVPSKSRWEDDSNTLGQYEYIPEKALFVQADEADKYRKYEDRGWRIIPGDWQDLYSKRNSMLDWFQENSGRLGYDSLVMSDDDVVLFVPNEDYVFRKSADPAKVKDAFEVSIAWTKGLHLDFAGLFGTNWVYRTMVSALDTGYLPGISAHRVFYMDRGLVVDRGLRFLEDKDLPEDLVMSVLLDSVSTVRKGYFPKAVMEFTSSNESHFSQDGTDMHRTLASNAMDLLTSMLEGSYEPGRLFKESNICHDIQPDPRTVSRFLRKAANIVKSYDEGKYGT